MADWLDPATAKALVESSANAESPAWVSSVDAAVDLVANTGSGWRRDLWTSPEPPAEPVFAATAAIKHGTAMLANRLYTRRTSPLGSSQNVEFGGTEFLRQDPDIAKLLGIAQEGAFVFGAGATFDPVTGLRVS